MNPIVHVESQSDRLSDRLSWQRTEYVLVTGSGRRVHGGFGSPCDAMIWALKVGYDRIETIERWAQRTGKTSE